MNYRLVCVGALVAAVAVVGGCVAPRSAEESCGCMCTPEPAPDQGSPPTEDSPATLEQAGALQPGDLVGVSMPWKGTQSWTEGIEKLGPALEAAGFQAVVNDAGNDSGKQVKQIEAMIAQCAKVIVVGAVDGTQLGDVLDRAKDQGVIVLGYDRTIDDTKSVDGVVQYGGYTTGVMEAQALVMGLEEKGVPKPWTIELFAGAPSDPDAVFFFDGAMSLLQPMIDAGDVTVGSGEVEFADVATGGWSNEKARTRMEELLTSTYTDGPGPVGVLAPSDGISRAILTACADRGLDLPVVGGLNAEDISIGWIRTGKQYATVSRPTDPLVGRTLDVLNPLLTSQDLPGPDFTVENGVKEVPIYSLDPTIVTKANINDFFPCDAAADAEQATNWMCD